jgi:transcriptional regulator with XRE-family HTH domain
MATDICVRLGRKIRELRRSRGWRQIDLAEHSGISKNHISELERGQREVGLKNLEAVAEALDLRPSELLRVSGL